MGFLKKVTRAVGLDTVFPWLGTGSAAVDALTPKMPDVPGAPLTPDTDPAAQAAIAEAERLEREAQLRARGRASTVLTGGAGDTSTASTARRALLGG